MFFINTYTVKYINEAGSLKGSPCYGLCVRILTDKTFNVINHMGVADKERTTLVQAFRHDVQNTLFTVARLAASLFGQERHWVAFIQQTQLAVRVACRAWVEVDTAFQQVAVEVSNQRADIAGRVRALSGFIFFLAELDVFLHAVRESDVVAFVDGVGVALLREAHTFLAQAENAQRGIVSKGVNAAARGVHQHGGGAINDVTGCHLVTARLQEIFLCHRRANRRDAAVDGENGTDRNVNVDVRGTVQRIHQHNVFSVFTPFENDNFIFFFGGDTRHDVARAQCSFQFFICEQIEFLLNLALNVLGTAGTQDIDQTGLVDITVDDLSAQLYCRQQSSEFTRSMRKLVLLFDNKFT
ncbi:hypothetical protein EcWSU1_00434 [Enterobacter ludwigii]|uniref:Uncharacterized protein n=1 Tax=Enterobacter ludwigii TaxID=299767 RepID=G8LJE0_9ENTR|nr:hypothetical protein EcWSU1_00434 [Enterobacter ludwigii]